MEGHYQIYLLDISLLATGKTWAERWDRKMWQPHKKLWKLLTQWPPDLNVHTLRATKDKYSLLLDSQYLALCLVQFSSSVVSDSLRPDQLQHTRPPCPLPTPRVHLNPCLLCRWCHPAISSSVIPFCPCPQSFPASGSFQMTLVASGGQSIGVSTSASVLPMNTQDWSPLGWTGWISLQSK